MQTGIVAQRGNPRAASLADELRHALGDRDVAVRIDESTAAALDLEGAPIETFDDCDLVVAIGGDGTLLFAARNADGTPIIGVNLGEVGFLNAVSPENAESAVLSAVEGIRANDLSVREAPRLVAQVDGWESNPAANEIVIQGERRGHGGGVDYEVRVDGSIYTGSHADGVLVATPTGSTAYNLSEGGPIVHPDLEIAIVNEMCARDGMPPFAVDLDTEVTVSVTGAGPAIITSDGREPHEIEGPAEITISRSATPMRIAGPQSDFFEALGKLS
ncbi:NAD(+)/NADH kinase [Halopenitus sp. H-Gu1]|uniref:NAD(+)/NADH kinase n=1 Tax=Halopenitus sp. H-Gu1 TaxID=3242697 RepID=UPI00359CE43D